MRILLIEDDVNKAEHITSFIRSLSGTSDVKVRQSYQSGLKEAVLHPYDLILLDMTMPSYDVGPREPGGRDRRYAGREILRQLVRRCINVPVIVITQYEQFEENGESIPLSELVAALASEYSNVFRGAVFYQAGNSSWMDELSSLFFSVEENNGNA